MCSKQRKTNKEASIPANFQMSPLTSFYVELSVFYSTGVAFREFTYLLNINHCCSRDATFCEIQSS